MAVPADPKLLLAARARCGGARVGADRPARDGVEGAVAASEQPLLGRGVRYQWQILRSVLYLQSDMYRSKLPPSLYPLYPLVRVPAWLISRLARIARALSGSDKSATLAGKTR